MLHPAPQAVDEGNGETRSTRLTSSLGRRTSVAASSTTTADSIAAAAAAPAVAIATAMADLRDSADLDHASRTDSINNSEALQLQQQRQLQLQSDSTDSGAPSAQCLSQSVPNSQESRITSSPDHAVTPAASDISSATDAGAGGRTIPAPSSIAAEQAIEGPDRNNHLLQLSTIAAAQDRIMVDAGAGTRKRMADGEVKAPRGSMSPIKGHSRNLSTVSVASTGSTIGELSAELKTRLSYAMVKVNLGWQARSLEEVESMASQAVSPSSSSSTAHRRHGSSASPRTALTVASAQAHFAQDSAVRRRNSESPPNLLSNKPTLAPPAPIQPLSSMPAPRSNPRRNSSPRYAATMLSHSHSASPHTPGQPMQLDNHQPLSQGVRMADPILFPSHQNVREQDAIESLLFMSSPNNSANLKHSFSPSGSPGPQLASVRSTTGRHALPSGPRKGLPAQRPSLIHKRATFDRSPGMLHPADAPMDLDSPQHSYYSPNRTTPKRRVKGTTNHLRGALSLPAGLGAGHNGTRRVLRDEDIERMLDRAGAETADSSDDEEIQIPRGRNGVMGVRG